MPRFAGKDEPIGSWLPASNRPTAIERGRASCCRLQRVNGGRIIATGRKITHVNMARAIEWQGLCAIAKGAFVILRLGACVAPPSLKSVRSRCDCQPTE